MIRSTLCGVEMGLIRASVPHRKGGAQAAMEFLAASHGKYPFAGLVERWFSLDDAEEAMSFAEQSSAVRIGIRP